MSASPVAPAERSAVLDILRGLALLGIFSINIVAFASGGNPAIIDTSLPLADQLVQAGTLLFVESKFFSLFSFLFGVGFSVQLASADRSGGTGFYGRYFRRLAMLALFGVTHIVLLWEGDVLLQYAVVGCALFLFRGVSDGAIVKWIVGLLAVPLFFYLLLLGAVIAARSIPQAAEKFSEAEAKIAEEAKKEAAKRTRPTTYLGGMAERLQNYVIVAVLLVMRTPTVLAMFLAGFVMGRRGVFFRPEEHLGLLRSLAAWCLPIGLAVASAVTWAMATQPPITAFTAFFFNQGLAGPVLALGYVAALTLVVRHLTGVLKPVGNVGRMGLTNYLTQSVVATILFAPYALGYETKVRPALLPVVAFGIFCVQMVVSTLWLRVFAFGPMEWLWRTATYGKVPRA